MKITHKYIKTLPMNEQHLHLNHFLLKSWIKNKTDYKLYTLELSKIFDSKGNIIPEGKFRLTHKKYKWKDDQIFYVITIKDGETFLMDGFKYGGVTQCKDLGWKNISSITKIINKGFYKNLSPQLKEIFN